MKRDDEMEIESMKKEHWTNVKRIYEEGIQTGIATFNTEAPTWKNWNGDHHLFGRLVAVEGNQISGWVALSPLSKMPAYSGWAEVSIYIASNFQGKGLGKSLLKAVIDDSEKNGIWTLEAKIIEENKASIALHSKLGFRIVGIRERIGNLNDEWKNTVIMERRSRITGLE